MNITERYIDAAISPDILVIVSDVDGSRRFTMTHDEIIDDLRGLLSTAGGERRLILDAAIGHVESDRATGTSLAAWPEMRALVERSLAWALGSTAVDHAQVTTAWRII